MTWRFLTPPGNRALENKIILGYNLGYNSVQQKSMTGTVDGKVQESWRLVRANGKSGQDYHPGEQRE